MSSTQGPNPVTILYDKSSLVWTLWVCVDREGFGPRGNPHLLHGFVGLDSRPLDYFRVTAETRGS